MVTKLSTLILIAALIPACGDDGKSTPRGGGGGGGKAAKKDPANPATGNKPGGPGGKGKDGKAPPQLQTYPKVAAEFRKQLEKSDFAPDATGDINRDPFRSYLIDLAQVAGKGKKGAGGEDVIEDECEEKGVVAESFGLRDLKLVGIVLRGTRTYALFTDSQNLGHTANRGDCISKERARVKDIGADRVTMEIRGQAPPGAPAPPPREEVWKLYPDELELQPGSGGGPR